jgi:hypothetical protein
MWYIHKMKYYAVIKRKDVLIYTTTWMKLENIILNERNRTYKVIYCMIPFV